MGHFAHSVQKEVVCAQYCLLRVKSGFILRIPSIEIMGRPRRTIHIDHKTESLWQKNDALCLVGPEGRVLLWAVKTWRNGQWYKLPRAIDQFEAFPVWEKIRIPKEATQSHFSSWQCSITYGKTGSQHAKNTQLGSSTPCDLLTRLGSFWLPLVCIDTLRTCWAAI